jgi:hypothetical protein
VYNSFIAPRFIGTGYLTNKQFKYSAYLSDINYGNIAYVRQYKKIGMLYTAISYVNYGRFEYAGVDGERNGTFGASETALIVGYAYSIPKTKIQAGINSKFIYSSLESYTSTGLAFDFGLTYNNEKQGIQSALVFRNLGFQLSSYQNTRENLPFEIDFTFSKTFLHAPFKWFVTLENLQKPKIAFVNTAHSTQDPNGNTVEEEIRIVDHVFRHIILGVELFPRKRFNIRAGYNFRRGAELGLKDQNFSSGINAGFGLRLRKFEINYGYGGYSFASNTHYFSIIVDLNKF